MNTFGNTFESTEDFYTTIIVTSGRIEKHVLICKVFICQNVFEHAYARILLFLISNIFATYFYAHLA